MRVTSPPGPRWECGCMGDDEAGAYPGRPLQLDAATAASTRWR